MVVAAGEKAAVERQCGASMMEQLVPEITTHALSYLDYPSLCRLSMTNSLMRKAANDDNAWKALYHKDFTLEQVSVTPVNGWKAYYAATRAIVNLNAEFFSIIRESSLQEMSRFWLNADYVKCIHASGELFSGKVAWIFAEPACLMGSLSLLLSLCVCCPGKLSIAFSSCFQIQLTSSAFVCLFLFD
ncbi:unnamed protein product [Linum tenue]|nr:unnamed protein product [Linum tenue]